MKRLSALLLVCVALALSAPSAFARGGQAAEAPPPPPKTPLERFQGRLERIQGNLERSNDTMRKVLATLDWNAWCRAHESYVRSVTRSIGELEEAIGLYMIGVLDAGGKLDSPVLEAIDNGGDAVGLLAKHKARITAYAALTRRRVRPEKRRDALDYLGVLGVYELSEKLNDATGKILAPDSDAVIGDAPTATSTGLGENPMSGRIPGTPEAGIALSKWQFAYMQAEQNIQRIAALETQLETLPAASRGRPMAEEQVAAARDKQSQLIEKINEWREKYFEAGGR